MIDISPARSILFCREMVRAYYIDRIKTETRRLINPQPPSWAIDPNFIEGGKKSDKMGWVWADSKSTRSITQLYPSIKKGVIRCRYGISGDSLWVKETWRIFGGEEYEYQQHKPSVRYRADIEDFEQEEWRPSIFMPMWASRFILHTWSITAARVQDITEEEAIAEGVKSRAEYAILWDRLNAKRGFPWIANPWVWVIKFPAYAPKEVEFSA